MVKFKSDKINLRWTVGDVVDYYAPIMEMFQNGSQHDEHGERGADHEQQHIKEMEKFLQIEVS